MSIRDRIADAMREDYAGFPVERAIRLRRAAAILAACPEIAALDHAREGWLSVGPDGWAVTGHKYAPDAPRVLVVDAPESA